MVKEPNYVNCRYMEQKNFIDFCKENSVEIRVYDLETFEKEKLFYPIKRWLFPEEYAIFDQQRSVTETYTPTFNFNCSSLLELEDEIFRFRNLTLYNNINHPFDEIEEDWQQYLNNPIDSEFVNWEDYEVNYNDEYGNELKTTRAKNYYSYWQIYELDGINDFRTKYHIICYNKEENNYYLSCDKDFVERWYKRQKRNISIFFQLEQYYNCLCEFIQFYERNVNIAFMKLKVGDSLTNEEIDLLESNLIGKSNQLITFYNFTVDNLYDFIETLCRQYFLYEYKEKSKLQSLIKRDIWYCIRLILYLTGDTWENISLKIGRKGQMATYFKLYSRAEKNTLEVLFPNEREEIKERAMLHVDRQVENYNKKSTLKYQLTKTDISNFIEFMETNDLDHFLLFITDVNADYFSQKYKSKKNLAFYLRNLSIFIEEIIKTIGLNSIDEIRTQYLDIIYGFKTILKPICKQEPWWSTYCYLEKNRIYEVNSDNFIEKIDQIPEEINKCKIVDNQRQFILLNISRATIIRNYYAHNSAQINGFKEKYLELFQSLIYSIFIIWSIGKDIIEKGE